MSAHTKIFFPFFAGLVILLPAALFVRLACVASRTEIGWETVAWPFSCWSCRFVFLGRSARTVAAVWLLLYLLLMPGLLTSGENVYQMQMAYLRNPGEYIRAMTDTMAEVRAELIQLEKKDAEP
jgi:hypothetical protein